MQKCVGDGILYRFYTCLVHVSDFIKRYSLYKVHPQKSAMLVVDRTQYGGPIGSFSVSLNKK